MMAPSGCQKVHSLFTSFGVGGSSMTCTVWPRRDMTSLTPASFSGAEVFADGWKYSAMLIGA